MKFKNLTLYTNCLSKQKSFYKDTFQLDVIDERRDSFTLQVGWSQLTFKESTESHLYHYCFLIPVNQLKEALQWVQQRTAIVEIDENRFVQNFEDWNASSFYFYDACGNIAEFIVRYDLKNQASKPFDSQSILAVNEIGMPTNKISEINKQLEAYVGSKFWKGDINRFGTNGDQEGLFLLPNYEIKKEWFPSLVPIKPEPFHATIQNHENIYKVEYSKEKLIFHP